MILRPLRKATCLGLALSLAMLGAVGAAQAQRFMVEAAPEWASLFDRNKTEGGEKRGEQKRPSRKSLKALLLLMVTQRGSNSCYRHKQPVVNQLSP